MLRARQVFQAKYGRGDELVALFQEFNTRMREAGEAQPALPHPHRRLRPVLHRGHGERRESFADWESKFTEAMAQPLMEDWFGRMIPLVESGRREFHHVVE